MTLTITASVAFVDGGTLTELTMRVATGELSHESEEFRGLT
jgi:hypothetical protein